jgi:hypothetical protein
MKERTFKSYGEGVLIGGCESMVIYNMISCIFRFCREFYGEFNYHCLSEED